MCQTALLKRRLAILYIRVQTHGLFLVFQLNSYRGIQWLIDSAPESGMLSSRELSVSLTPSMAAPNPKPTVGTKLSLGNTYKEMGGCRHITWLPEFTGAQPGKGWVILQSCVRGPTQKLKSRSTKIDSMRKNPSQKILYTLHPSHSRKNWIFESLWGW
jgi:hypothetical protein